MNRLAKVLAACAVIVAVGWWPTKNFLIERYGVSELTMGRKLILARLGLADRGSDVASMGERDAAPGTIELDSSIRPFRERGARLGERALGNDFFSIRGAAIFDANGDGRLDVYIPHPGRTLAKRTERGVLTEERVPALPGALLLNQGNDEAGDPLFASVQELIAAGNDQFVAEELLIENKYRPRRSLADDEHAPGRIAWGAVSADFNGDGRLDLYVLNAHYGLLHQTHQLGLPVYPAPTNLGREARREPLVLRLPSFLWTPLSDGLHQTVDLGGGPEAEGRNSLYLNLGDRDGDGIPEWEDATEAAGLGGHWSSTSAAIADYDRDGDLDLYVTNFLDPDYFGFGSDRFAGHRNQLYQNQLADSGRLEFRDVAAELKVAGLHQEEGLESSVYFPSEGRFVPISKQIVDGAQVGEEADHSWAATFVDMNRDHYPDLIVANDISNRLRVYENLGGERFRYLERFNQPEWEGCWMGMSVGDLDGDLAEDVFLTNCGSQVMSVRNNALMIEDGEEANIQALAVLNYTAGRCTLHHEILSFDQQLEVRRRGTEATVHHSEYIPPDMSQRENFARRHQDLFGEHRFDRSLAGFEFAWNAPMFDVDNDGDLDVYLAGSLMRGNDNFLGDWSGSPGRLLVNESSGGELVFRDRTLEYQLLDIADVDYAANPPRRQAPGTGWHKRDYIYLTDTDAYGGMGLEASRSATRDLFRMHEAAWAVLAADVNGDGYQDLLVTHAGGYNSVSPRARNLKVAFAGRELAVPAPNKVMNAPTDFEPGSVFLHLNSGPPQGAVGQWVKLRLHDPSSHNHFAVGARVIVNDRLARSVQATTGAAFGGANEDLHVGLGEERLEMLEIVWPAGGVEPERLVVSPPRAAELVCVRRGVGIVPCDSVG